MWSRRYRSFGDYSVTTLLNPVRVVHLARRHPTELRRSLASQISAFVGSGVHLNFEESIRSYSIIDPRYMVERTVMDKVCDRIITGRFDILYDEKHIYDIKTAKTWKVIYDPGMKEWHEQQNIYAHLLRARGCDVHSINIVALYLDWNKSAAFRQDKYPPHPVVEYKLNLWDDAVTRSFLEGKVTGMKEHETTPDDELPECTDDEMWVRDTSYAVMKEGQQKAVRVFPELKDAAESLEKYQLRSDGRYSIQTRPGRRVRCEEFCECNEVCGQWKKWRESNG